MSTLTKICIFLLVFFTSVITVYACELNLNSASFNRSQGDHLFITDSSQENLDITGSITIEGWVNLETQPGTENGEFFPIVSKFNADIDDGAYSLEYRSGPSRFDFIISTDGEHGSHCVIEYYLESNQWHHVAATLNVDNQTCEIYVDGVSIGKRSGQSASIHNSSAPFRIGRDNYSQSTSNYFDGMIDEVRVWSRSLTADEVIENYNKLLTGDESGLEGYWRLENNYHDETSNGNDLTPANDQTFTSDVPFLSECDVLSAAAHLAQHRVDGVAELADGEAFAGNSVVFSGDVGVDSGGVTRGIEVEVKPFDVAFDGTSTHVSELATEAIASVKVSDFFTKADLYSGLNQNDFKWRARTVDEEGGVSGWVEFGDAAADFSLTAVPLVTQVVSDNPSEEATASWAEALYAGGDDEVCGTTIASCGCALSSLSTLAYHHGITEGADGSAVNPKNLNDWLMAHNGFDSANNVKWLAALEYFAPVGGEATSYFEYLGSTADTEAVGGLLEDTPVIAFDTELPGGYSHFFVLDSVLGGGYEISDPQWYTTETTGETYAPELKMQSYGDTFNSARLIRVSAEALALGSALEVHHSGGEVLVTDAYGNQVGEDFASDEIYDDIAGGEFSVEPSVYSGDELPGAEPTDWKVIRITDTDSPYFIISISGEAASEYFTSIFYRDDEGGSDTTSYEGVFPATGELILTAGEMTVEGKLLALMYWLKSNIEEFGGVLGDIVSDRAARLEEQIFAGEMELPRGQLKRLENWFSSYVTDDIDPQTFVGLITSVLNSN